MADALKDSFSLDVIERIAAAVGAVHPDFPAVEFVASAADGFLELELTARARHIARALAVHLPADPGEALTVLSDSLGPPLGERESDGMDSFVYLPHVFYVAEHGLDHFEQAMAFQYEVTRRFTAEFSIRAFLDRYPEATLERLRTWAADSDMHVRRLVSEGTRPRLPWAPRLNRFVADPEPVLELLELLKDDPTEYVRRSVANNLNDISKDHPDRVVEILADWSQQPTRSRLVRHALRSLVKKGHPGALALLGYHPSTGLVIETVEIDPRRVLIGEMTSVTVKLTNPMAEPESALVDLRVHFVKANGKLGPKVFKGKEITIGPAETEVVRKTISLASHTTRTPYPGTHHVEVVINGVAHDGGMFEVTVP